MKMEDIMKKILSAMLAAALCVSLAACSSDEGSSSSVAEDGNSQIDTLRVAFVPSREPEEIITATEPLKEMLITELAKEGYDVGDVRSRSAPATRRSARACPPAPSMSV